MLLWPVGRFIKRTRSGGCENRPQVAYHALQFIEKRALIRASLFEKKNLPDRYCGRHDILSSTLQILNLLQDLQAESCAKLGSTLARPSGD